MLLLLINTEEWDYNLNLEYQACKCYCWER